MSGNPVKYAEGTLGVHDVWEESQKRMTRLETALAERSEGVTAIRRLKSAIADRERDLTSDLTAEHADAKTATERNRLVKEGLRADARLQDLRSELDELQATQDLLDGEVKLHETGLHVLAARMSELGGLLQFYAGARKS